MTLKRFFFQIRSGSIKGPQVVEFIQNLQRHLKAHLLIIWDGAAIHRSKLVAQFLRGNKRMVVAERLPAYAPELNPVEYMWSHLKCHEIANLITTQAWELSVEATKALRRMRHRPSIIAACLSQAESGPICQLIVRGSIKRRGYCFPAANRSR